MSVVLQGGPADGRSVEIDGCELHVPEMVPPVRQATAADPFYVDPFRFVDPDLNPTFKRHRYTREGKYVGVMK